MSWFDKKISHLQHKSYGERLKLLKISLFVTGIILIIIWAVTLRYRKSKFSSEPSNFGPILENLKNLKKLKP